MKKKPSELFEGENSTLRRTFDRACRQPKHLKVKHLDKENVDRAYNQVLENQKLMNHGQVYSPQVEEWGYAVDFIMFLIENKHPDDVRETIRKYLSSIINKDREKQRSREGRWWKR